MDRLEALKLFVRVVEAGSFSEAARGLGLGQPQVSRAVALLEDRWGAQLIRRSTRTLSLTEAGQRVFDRARELLDLADGLESSVRGVDREPVGLLRVSASVAFARAEVVPHVPEFLGSNPHVRLDLVTADERVDIVAEGIDLAFRLGALEDSSLTARRLGAYRRVLAAAPAYLDRAGRPEQPRDLARHDAVIFTSSRHGARWPLSRSGANQEVEVRGVVAASSGRVLSDFVRQGLGVALGPSFLFAPDFASGRLSHVLPDWSGPPLEVHAVWARRDLPSKARAFLNHVAPRLTVN